MADRFSWLIEIAMETRGMTASLALEETPATETDMAKAAPADPVLVSRYAEALAAVGRNRIAFEELLSEIKSDTDVRKNDIVEIAVVYRGGGVRPRSKRHALEMIEKRFVEIVRDAQKRTMASRARPW
jgi:hypothetical protein